VDPRRPLRKQCTDPAIQVYQSDRHTFILRVSKAVSFEAPFIFLLFGNERAVLFDTGPSADPAKIPLRRTVDELVDAWLADHPRDDYELVVAHTHGHHDHRDGDPQFADRPRATVVGHTAEEVRGFFGFSEWPGQIVSFDLGGRVLELTGTPGHHPASVTVYDPWTGFVLTGDTIMQGRLYAKEYPDFLQSLERLLEFAAQRNITRVPACHIEISRTPGHDYPAGNTYQPDEVSLRLSAERITEIRHAARAFVTSRIEGGRTPASPAPGTAVLLLVFLHRVTALIPRLRRYARLAAEEYALSAIPGLVLGRPLPRRAMRTWFSSGMNCRQSPCWPGSGSG
jgi:hydroxyacylglutathione hydrolase